MDYEGEDKKTDIPAIGITLNQRYDDYRTAVFQTFVAADCSIGEFNRMLDKLRVAAERQKAIAHLPTFKGLLADKEAALKNEVAKHLEFESEKSMIHDSISRVMAGSDRRNPKQSPAQIQALAKAEAQIGGSKSAIAILQKEIETHKRQIADLEQLIKEGELDADAGAANS